MSKIKVIADNKIPFLKGALEKVAEIEYYPGKSIAREHVMHADALLVRTRTLCNADLLRDTSVNFIATATIGFDHIDAEFCRQNNIEWKNAPGCNSSSVEQYIVSALLSMAEKHSFKLKDQTIGIVGVGNVGSKVANAARALGMNVLLNDPPRERLEKAEEFVSLETIIEDSDIISFHVPLNMTGDDKTWHLADKEFLNNLKKDVIVINSSRGGVIDERALLEALRSGKVRDTVIDVWENEPKIDRDLLHMAGIATPHVAGYSVDGKANGTMMSVRALSAYFELGLSEWKPEGVPEADAKSIVIDCGSMNEEEILRELYFRTYDIEEDDKRLRGDVNNFEQLRGNYPVRREPSFYSVRLNNNPYEFLDDILKKLGFSVLEIDCFC